MYIFIFSKINYLCILEGFHQKINIHPIMVTKGECPNINGCQVLHKEGFVKDEQMKEFYKTVYCCCCSPEGYPQCMRFRTKNTLNFCPDFILPDSDLTLDEIMERLENEED